MLDIAGCTSELNGAAGGKPESRQTSAWRKRKTSSLTSASRNGAYDIPELTTCASSRCDCKGVTTVRIAFYGWDGGSHMVVGGLIGDLIAASRIRGPGPRKNASF